MLNFFLCVYYYFPSIILVDWTVKCGPGWESNPITSNCYMFVDEPLTWLDAVNQCQNFHGNLVAIESLEEQNYLAGQQLSYCFLNCVMYKLVSVFSCDGCVFTI